MSDECSKMTDRLVALAEKASRTTGEPLAITVTGPCARNNGYHIGYFTKVHEAPGGEAESAVVGMTFSATMASLGKLLERPLEPDERTRLARFRTDLSDAFARMTGGQPTA